MIQDDLEWFELQVDFCSYLNPNRIDNNLFQKAMALLKTYQHVSGPTLIQATELVVRYLVEEEKKAIICSMEQIGGFD